MIIVFHTNLDLAQRDVSNLSYTYSTSITELPRKGDLIQFDFDIWDQDAERNREANYQLEVVSIVHNYHQQIITVELHIPRHHGSMSIADWEKWFNKHRFNRNRDW